jgi:hypothetical protein
MSSRRFAAYDPGAPRYNIMRAKGSGVLGFAYVEPFARRRAAEIAEEHGETVIVIDLAKGKYVATVKPSEIAIARRKARPKARFTEGGQPATKFLSSETPTNLYLSGD